MPWFKRRFRPYDDNYDVHTEFFPNPVIGNNLSWYVPSDRYIIPTALVYECSGGLTQPGAVHSFRILQYRHDRILGASRCTTNFGVNAPFHILLSPGIPEESGNSFTPFWQTPLAFPWHFHPGDLLKFEVGRYMLAATTDQLNITYRYWKIY